MAKPTHQGTSAAVALDPSQMSEEQLRSYVAQLERALTSSQESQAKISARPDWKEGEKRWVMVPKTPTNDVLTINGKPYIGRMHLDVSTWCTIMEMHSKAVQSELARMQTRGNLVPPHLLPQDDVSSRAHPELLAHL